jgi:hypothetical protein
MYSSIEDSEVLLVFVRSNAGLKKLSSFVWTDKWSPNFLNAMCLLKYVYNCEYRFSYVDPDYQGPA